MGIIFKYFILLILFLQYSHPVLSQTARDYYLKGVNLLNSGEYESSINEFNSALQLDPLHADSFYHRGIAKAHLHDFEAASVDMNKAIELNQEMKEPYSERLPEYTNKEELRKAIRDSTKSIENNPANGKAYLIRGVAKIKLGNESSGCMDIYNANKFGYTVAYSFIKDFCDSFGLQN